MLGQALDPLLKRCLNPGSNLGYDYVLEKVSLEYRHFWAVLAGNAH